MVEINIFEQATRNRIRFPYKGIVSVEDLWDLSVQELDKIFKFLNKSLKTSEGESLLGTKNKADTDLELQIAIVRHIVEVKLAEMTARELEKEKKQKRQKIMGILVAKQDEALQSLSEADLKKMLDEL
ncbi:MAG: hypothetical protein M0R80_04055 [Proteobacteria bacterium]|jgi:hypothetical protein|nr:hypothetical protein [Pseudomonadota bacterium]